MDNIKPRNNHEFSLEGVLSKLMEALLSLLLILLSLVVIGALFWAVIQFVPWIEPYLRRFYTSVQIGWGLISVAGGALFIAAIIIYRA